MLKFCIFQTVRGLADRLPKTSDEGDFLLLANQPRQQVAVDQQWVHQVLDEQQALSLSILKPDLHNLTKWPLTTSRRAVPHTVSQFVNGQASNNISKNDNNNNTNSHWTDGEAILSFSNTEEIVIPGELKVTIRWGERKKWIPTPRIQNETLNFIRKLWLSIIKQPWDFVHLGRWTLLLWWSSMWCLCMPQARSRREGTLSLNLFANLCKVFSTIFQ